MRVDILRPFLLVSSLLLSVIGCDSGGASVAPVDASNAAETESGPASADVPLGDSGQTLSIESQQLK